MRIATITQIVDDDFEKGNCHECPFTYESDEYYDLTYICMAHWRYDECGLEIKDEEN